MALAEINAYLAALAPGKLSSEDNGELIGLLFRCWEMLAGGTDGGMAASKLSGRAEQFYWEPPVLSFCIERHGAIVKGGSSRAEVQGWMVNLESATASCSVAGFKQEHPARKPLDVKTIAARILESILKSEEDPRLKWQGLSRVTVSIGQAIPADAPKQTVNGRRKRFRKELERILEPHGWRPTATGTQCVFENNGL